MAKEKTLRDEIAIAAMQAIISKTPLKQCPTNDGSWQEYAIAIGAYSYADQMLKYRVED